MGEREVLHASNARSVVCAFFFCYALVRTIPFILSPPAARGRKNQKSLVCPEVHLRLLVFHHISLFLNLLLQFCVWQILSHHPSHSTGAATAFAQSECPLQLPAPPCCGGGSAREYMVTPLPSSTPYFSSCRSDTGTWRVQPAGMGGGVSLESTQEIFVGVACRV